MLNDPPQFERFMSTTRPIDLDGIDWDAIADHPLPHDILKILAYMQDVESHTVVFPLWQAEERLARPGVSRKVRAIMDRFYTPVGVSHQPDQMACWVSGFLFDGDEGRAAAKHVDATIAKLPGFSDAKLLGDWLERKVYH
jgi:hypothetical protein